MTYLATGFRLGPLNVLRVIAYRSLLRAGAYRRLLPAQAPTPLGLRVTAANGAAPPTTERDVVAEADALLAGTATYFSVHRHRVGSPPDWFLDPFTGYRHPTPARHWSEIPDFGAGDIKVVWELSRFGWALAFARAWRVSGEGRYLTALQDWVEDWWCRNPPNVGPNWKCGQETSLRLINTLLALELAGAGATAALEPFVLAHCRRIGMTTFYAVAQDNNHGTSEAAALLISGHWLEQHATSAVARRRGSAWNRKGRRLLEERVVRLVMADGSFAQHSLTYHRLLLDTLSIVEAWRRKTSSKRFSPRFYERAAAATQWLAAMIDPASGDAPNLGANDGALPFSLGGGGYRDFRPCLQLAARLFSCGPALQPGPWDEPARWLAANELGTGQPWLHNLVSKVFDDGGYIVLRDSATSRAVLRAPTARFRPSQADALHVDFWHGENLLRDGGTYAYAVADATPVELAAVSGHNTLQFDDHDQMPRLGRFLYGDWIRVRGAGAVQQSGGKQSWTGSYRDAWGVTHERSVQLGTGSLRVRDRADGFKQKAVLRWRLAPAEWRVDGVGCTSPLGSIRVESSVPVVGVRLNTGWESRHYLERTQAPVLEVEVTRAPATLTTTVAFA